MNDHDRKGQAYPSAAGEDVIEMFTFIYPWWQNKSV